MKTMKPQAPFDALSPDLVAECVEEAYGLDLGGLIFPYPSYVNRVYGLKDQDGAEYVAKFYRPGRWTQEAIKEEHAFLGQLAAAECPVVAPLRDAGGETLQILDLGDEDCDDDDAGTIANHAAGSRDVFFPFALFPKRGGRIFDAESDEDWLRLGALAGRVHVVGRQETAAHRPQLRPGLLGEYAAELIAAGVVHPDFVMDFQEACAAAGKILDPLLAGTPRFRIHGDFHRGNILVRGDQSLLLIDFDDAAMGPAIQDLWLLLPGRYDECRREMNLILEGYEEFSDFDRNELDLVEPLRFFRMVHFLRWQALQRSDEAFFRTFQDWGTRAFWTKEVEDLRDQLEFLY